MRLKEIRLSKNLTQKEVAKLINISQSNYSKYERNEIEPNIEILLLLSKLYNTSIDNLLDNHVNVNNEIFVLFEQLDEPNKKRVIEYAKDLLKANKK